MEVSKKTRIEMYFLAGLVVILGAVGYGSFSGAGGLTGATNYDTKFQPLKVQDPSLRVDLLDNLRLQEYKGMHRNIFSAEPLPPPISVMSAKAAAAAAAHARQNIEPPALAVPATFFGIVTELNTGKKRACFSNGKDNVFILPEGGVLLGNFRVDKILHNAVDLEQVSSGRHVTLTLAPTVYGGALATDPVPPDQPHGGLR
jgi:hypothetical protein